jgi:hypothetical protein
MHAGSFVCAEDVKSVAELRRLLLRHAMNCAQAPDKVSAVYADDLTIWKHVGKNIERTAIIRIVEGRHQNQAVGDIKIGVAGG